MIFLLFHLFLTFNVTFLNNSNQANEIKLDGQITEDQWKAANQYELAHGAKLYILKTKEKWYAGIRGLNPGWAHLYIQSKDSIRVLHASAALGQQVYYKQNDKWKIQSVFNWEFRERVYNPQVEQTMLKYFTEHGWVANNNNMGDKKTIEFMIDLKKKDFRPEYFAILITSNAIENSFYPLNLSDDTLLKDLIQGNNPDQLKFDPASWIKI